jgi:hypothetical protein
MYHKNSLISASEVLGVGADKNTPFHMLIFLYTIKQSKKQV